jgi:hypothetical protein
MDYHAQEYSEALLPKNKITNKFLALSEGDKLKTIELGMSMLDNGEKKLNSFNDRGWGEKLERAEKIAMETIEKLREEKELLNKNTEELRYKHKKDIVHLREKIKDETIALFTTELERLRAQREDLTQTLRKYNDKLLEQEKENQKNLQQQIREQREFYENKEKQIRIDFQNTIEKQAQLVTTIQDNSYKKEQNSTIKGQTGEDWVYNELLRQLKTVEIESTYHQAEKGDFVIKEPGLIGMIESKNYKKNVPKKEIDKFYRDMDKNPEYNYGILVSLDHGVARRDDFECEFRNGCPLIFLHKVKENPNKLLLAIKFCKLIEKNKTCIDITNEETIIKIKNLLKPIKTEYKNQKQFLNTFNTNMNTSIDNLFEYITGVLELLNIK